MGAHTIMGMSVWTILQASINRNRYLRLSLHVILVPQAHPAYLDFNRGRRHNDAKRNRCLRLARHGLDRLIALSVL